MSKGFVMWCVILIFIIAVTLAIFVLLKSDNIIDEETAKCIASKSELYIKKGCVHCEEQEQNLGEYFSLFKIIDCLDNMSICYEKSITEVPMFIIDGEKYSKPKSLKELKELTGC